MKLHHVSNNLQTNLPTDAAGTQFKVATNAKMFEILFSGIYQHKIAAIVREICTNAYDSHIDAGKKHVPFRVTLPNSLHPYFEVEDFGIGMDVETAINVFCVMGESTKAESNEGVGAWGLGSKTPFAYTSQFTIRMRKDGMERTAIAYLDASGGPRMDFISAVKWDGENGLTVTVPVREEDIDRFCREASFYLSFYDVAPEVIAPHYMPSYEISNIDPNAKYFFASRTNDTGYNAALECSDLYVLSGPVPYAVSISGLFQHETNRNSLMEIIRRLCSRSRPLFIKTSIGDVEPSTSRESLQLTEATVKFLTGRLKEIIEDIKRDFMEVVNDDSIHINHRRFVAVTKFGLNTVNHFERAVVDQGCSLPYKRHMSRIMWSTHKKFAEVPSVLSSRYSKKTVFNRIGGKTLESLLSAATSTNDRAVSGMSADQLQSTLDSAKLVFITNEKGTRIRKTVFDEHSGLHASSVLFIKRMTRSTADRIGRLIGCKVETIDYSVFHKKHLEHLKANRVKAAANKLGENEVYGSAFTITKNSDGKVVYNYHTQETIEVDPESAFYIEASYDSFRIGDGKYCGYESVVDFLKSVLLQHTIKGEIIIVRKSDRNVRKLEANGIRPIEDFLKSGVMKTEENLMLSVLKNAAYIDVGKVAAMSSIGVFKNTQIEWLYEKLNKTNYSESRAILQYDESLRNRVLVIEQYVEELVERIDAFINNHCPLVSSGYAMHSAMTSTEDSLYKRHLIEYIGMAWKDYQKSLETGEGVQQNESSEKLRLIA